MVLEHFDQPRHRTLAADFGQRIDGAFAHPPVLVLGGFDEVADGAIVLGLVEDLDRGAADVFVLVADQLQHGFDDFRAADLAERVGGARAHPPVVVGHGFEQVFHRLRVADFVEHFDGGAARVLVFVLEHGDQVLDGLRIVGANHDVDGLVLHVDFRIAQQRAHLFDLDRAVHLGERAQGGGTHQLVGVLELLLQRALNLGLGEARQDVDDVQARHGIFAVQAADEFGQVVVGGELAQDAEQRGLFVGFLLVGRGQDFTHRQPRAMGRDHIQQRGLGDALGRRALRAAWSADRRGCSRAPRRRRPRHAGCR